MMQNQAGSLPEVRDDLCGLLSYTGRPVQSMTFVDGPVAAPPGILQ
jgi:hypothetical protein